ncbi:hypothetical protein EDD86DRAFT_244599 [Gorgonomyces haynaldii]|nr:hypothetical protein EDD86DRAFT_244599 [Gorgonomyces haynaldii]
MSLEDEAILRHKAAQFIFQLGAELNCPVYIVGKACDIGAASLFLSWKVTEDPKFPLPRLKNFVRAFVKIAAKKTETPPEDSKEFGKWKDTLLIHEHSLLEGICFDLELDNPYERLLSLKEELSGA